MITKYNYSKVWSSQVIYWPADYIFNAYVQTFAFLALQLVIWLA